MGRAIFNLNMKYKFTILLLALFAAVSCNNSPKVVTYQDAERIFVHSLDAEDTLNAVALCEEYMELLLGGRVVEAVDMLTVVENNVLYKMGPPSTDYLVKRYTVTPVTAWVMDSYSFSTQANNKFVCRYSIDETLPEASGLKIVFNPVKIEDRWYLALKEGPFKIHPLAPAPDPVKLNRKPEN